MSASPDIARSAHLRPVVRWLLVLYGLILVMVMIGGITRLTGSGLSMVEWRPLMGALPPLNDAEWHAVFEKYKQFPQYRQVNHWMTLADFQRIFFWEWFHRLFGRLIGLAAFLPWAWFVIRGRLRGRVAWRTFVPIILGGLQGALGWFMVKSGLVDVPAVSHYRLAAHLVLAFFVAQYVLWLALDLARDDAPAAPSPPALRTAAWALIGLTTIQIVYGAFMAGTRAGWLYATFPTMNGEWVPAAAFASGSTARALVADPAAIHFVHRTLAWLLAFGALGFWAFARRRLSAPRARRALDALAVLVGVQFGLGVLTVVLHVPTAVAVAHQGVACLLLSAAVAVAHALRPAPAPAAAPARPAGEPAPVTR